MTKKLNLDDGFIELQINNNGVLRFNPSDFNLYQRFCKLLEDLPKLEEQYRTQLSQTAEAAQEPNSVAAAGAELDRAKEIDATIKARLSAVFGAGNDFDALLGGASMMSFGRNGEYVITNLLNALMPYLEEGAHRHMNEAAAEAVSEAKQNRAQRRATK